MSDHIRSHTGDEHGSPGEGPWLEVFYHHDWYVRVQSLEYAGAPAAPYEAGQSGMLRRCSPAVRFRCSGAQNEVATMLVAALHASMAPESAPEVGTVLSRCVAAMDLALLRARSSAASFYYIDKVMRRGAERIMEFLVSEENYEPTVPLAYSGTHGDRRIHIIIEPREEP